MFGNKSAYEAIDDLAMREYNNANAEEIRRQTEASLLQLPNWNKMLNNKKVRINILKIKN